MNKSEKQLNPRSREIRSVLEKIVVNAGVGRASQLPNFSAGASGASDKNDKSVLAQIKRDLAVISGQAAETRPAKKSIAGFKIREGQIIGLRVTLRDRKMVDFFERLITIVMPRVHDFRGVALSSIDHGGTLNIGFREQLVFPEVNPEESTFIFPLGVNIVPRIKDRAAAVAAYRKLGVPLQAEGIENLESRKSKKKRKK